MIHTHLATVALLHLLHKHLCDKMLWTSLKLISMLWMTVYNTITNYITTIITITTVHILIHHLLYSWISSYGWLSITQICFPLFIPVSKTSICFQPLECSFSVNLSKKKREKLYQTALSSMLEWAKNNEIQFFSRMIIGLISKEKTN